MFVFFQAEDGIRDLVRSRGLGDVYKRQDSTGLTDLYDAIPLSLLPREKPFESSLPLKDVVVILNGAYHYQSGKFPVFNARLAAGPGSFLYRPSGIMIPEFQAGIVTSYDPGTGNYGSLEMQGLEVRSPALDLSLIHI